MTIDKAYEDKCDENLIFVDYANIVNIVKKGSRVYIDDGLISLIVTGISKINFINFNYI